MNPIAKTLSIQIGMIVLVPLCIILALDALGMGIPVNFWSWLAVVFLLTLGSVVLKNRS